MWESGSIDKTSKICKSAGWFQLQQNINLAKYVALLFGLLEHRDLRRLSALAFSDRLV